MPNYPTSTAAKSGVHDCIPQETAATTSTAGWQSISLTKDQANDFCHRLEQVSAVLVPPDAVDLDKGLYAAACWIYPTPLSGEGAKLLLQAVYDSSGCENSENPLWQNFTKSAADHDNVKALDQGACVSKFYDNLLNKCELIMIFPNTWNSD